MPIQDNAALGLSLRFIVTIDNGAYDLGSWHKAEGLSVKWDIAEHRVGDAGNMRWYFPGVSQYTNVKLTRATTAEGTKSILDWLTSNSFKSGKQTGNIVMQDAWNAEVAKWDLYGVMPVSWSGPSFDATASKVATETLELAHLGFLNDWQKPQ